jgi:CBS domain-containing protein
MTTPVVTVTPATPVGELARVLVHRRINGVPVVYDGRLVGIVTVSDLPIGAADSRDVARPSVWQKNFWRHTTDRRHPELDRAEGRTAAEVMTSRVLTVTPDTDLVSATRLLLEHNIQALPVLVGTDLVGIVTRHDVLQQIAEHGGTVNPLES